jgi:multimeric flavodoxin WrbA
LGSPIYFGTVSGEMKSFMERLLFPYSTYTDPPESLFPKKIMTGFLHTMGLTEKMMQEFGYIQYFNRHEMILKRIYGASEYMCSFDTYQFDDYSKVLSTRFDPVKKQQRRKEIFPKDCEKALAMGARFANCREKDNPLPI